MKAEFFSRLLATACMLTLLKIPPGVLFFKVSEISSEPVPFVWFTAEGGGVTEALHLSSLFILCCWVQDSCC